jgi:MoaA/NifB/PqqE/SkfB family radical SAM enzyme
MKPEITPKDRNPKIDTLRLILSLECNLHCTYCCNNIPEIKETFKPVHLNDINFRLYENVCISGGEPLLNIDLLKKVLKLIPRERVNIILYTNGKLLTRRIFDMLYEYGVEHISIGLHTTSPIGFVESILDEYYGTYADGRIRLRFNLNEEYKKYNGYLEKKLSQSHYTDLKYWKMNDCTRDNEEIFILKGKDDE